MTPLPSAQKSAVEELLRLSDLVDRPVFFDHEKIGSLSDFVIVDKDVVAEVTHVQVSQPFGRPNLYVPWQNVKSLTLRSVEIELPNQPTGPSNGSGAAAPTSAFSESPAKLNYSTDYSAVRLKPVAVVRGLEIFEEAPPNILLLEDFIVDKKVLDVEGREVEVVYDVILARKEGRLYVVGVDLSRRALLRRIGLRWLANLTASITDTIEKDIVAWNLVEPLPEGIGSFAGDIRLKVVKAELAKMPPVDVARILEQLGMDHRLAIFDGMDASAASDALEELDPKSQRELVAAMPKEKVGRLIDVMTPAQAADVLAVLPWSDVHTILAFLDREKAKKVQEILKNQDQIAANYVSSDYIKLHPDTTVLEARQSLTQAREREAVAYLYVLDEDDHLLGMIPTTDLLTARDDVKMKDIMRGAPVTLSLDGTLKDATETFGRYGYRALPVVDRYGKMHGIVPQRDVMTLRTSHHHE